MEQLEQLVAYAAFGLYLVIIIAGGLAAVLCRDLVRALMGLILTLFGVAGMYFLLAAPFLALMQILIYVGAVSVLIFFAIMLTREPGGDAGLENAAPRRWQWPLVPLLCGLIPAGVLAIMVVGHSPEALPLKAELPLSRLGQFLVGPYALAFELISVVLVVAMAGAVLLGFERRKSL
jgi:NADH:ubiquinone oxidoreductase subunit 6 (subunit J)